MRHVGPKARQRPAPALASGSTTTKAPLRLNLIGKVAAFAHDSEIDLANRKCRALLGYLALSDAAEDTRERVIGLLWSETDEERARASLRQALYEVRTALESAGFDVLSATKVAIALDRKNLDVDIWSVLAEAKAGRAHPLLLETERVADALLAEFETIDPAYRVWLLAKRQALHDRLVRHLEQALRDDNASATRADVARALLNLDPTHEEGARLLMRARADAGDIGGALTIYKRLWDLLEQEYDVEPSKETQELVAALKLAQPGPPSSSAVAKSERLAFPAATHVLQPRSAIVVDHQRPAPTSAKLVIGIGGFDASGIAADHVYLVQGFRRELIANLVRFREWAVRDDQPGAAGASAANHQEYLIEATALKGGPGIRLVVTLRDLHTHEYAWSDQYSLSLDDWSDAQQHLVHRIATALNVYLSASRLSLLAHHPDPYLKAYDRWLYAQSKIQGWNPSGYYEATQLLQTVIEEYPAFSPAYSTLAQIHNTTHFIHPGVFRDAARAQESFNYARQATRLDPVDSRGQLALGWACALARQHDLAQVHHGLAEELNDNDPWTVTSAALGLAMRGQLREARDAADRALQLGFGLAPQHWGYHLQIRFMSRDYEGGIKAAAAAGDLIPTSPTWKIAALGLAGHLEDARAEYRKYVDSIRSKWLGSSAPDEPAIARWTLHGFPIKRREDWEHFRDGLAAGGMPVAGLRHDAW